MPCKSVLHAFVCWVQAQARSAIGRSLRPEDLAGEVCCTGR
jgi:hypothetical protein